MKRRVLGAVAALAAWCVAGCIDFTGARAAYCAKNADAGLAVCGAGPADAPDAGPAVAPTPVAAPTAPIGPRKSVCAGSAGVPSSYYWVSPGGSDVNPGSHLSPLKTIQAAVNAAASTGRAQEVHVCKGTYSERVVLVGAVSLTGGWDCGAQTRATGCFDPALPDHFGPDAGALTTVLRDPGTAYPAGTTGRTLLVAVDAGVIIDGLAIIGPPAVAGGQHHAVEFVDATASSLTNSRVAGGAANCTNEWICSAGIYVGGGSPDIGYNEISGGSGAFAATDNYAGSVGVFLTGAAVRPHLHDNVINGGTGSIGSSASGPVGSAGVMLDDPADTTRASNAAIESNDINGGAGTVACAGCQATVGLSILWRLTHDSDIVGNVITGGNGHGGNPGSIGLHSNGGGNSVPVTSYIAGNKIVAGDNSDPGATLVGVQVDGSWARNMIVNNQIHAGNGAGTRTGRVVGVVFGTVQHNRNRLDHNVIVATGTSPATAAVELGNDPHADHQLEIANNILVGSSAGSAGLYFRRCLGSAVVPVLLSNLFVNTARAAAIDPAVGCSGSATFLLPSALEQALSGANPGNPDYHSNLWLASQCSGGAGCLARAPCTGVAATDVRCLQDLFGAWDGPTYGQASLLTTDGWNLNPSPDAGLPECALTRSATDDVNAFPWDRDLFGNPRTSPPSVGAVEYDSFCR